MKSGLTLLVLILCGVVFAQKKSTARATYAKNGALIGLAELAPLKDCSVRAMEGKAKNVKVEGGTVLFDLESKNQGMTFQFPLNRLASAEQRNFQNDFLHKGIRLRANGYACGKRSGPVEAISIDRVY
jgi:hypothetical protein